MSAFDSLGHDASLFPRLVLSRIEADFRVQIRIFQRFSKSTRKSPSRKQILQISAKFLHNFVKICKIFRNFRNFAKFLKKSAKVCKILQNFAKFCKICLREGEFLVDLEKCEKNAYLDAKIGVDPAENELWKE